MRRLLAVAAALYVVALLGDAVVTLADAALRLWPHSEALNLPRALLGFAAGAGALFLYVVGGFSRALPARLYGPAVVLPFALGLVMVPLVMALAAPLSISELVVQRPEVVAAKAPALLVAVMVAGLVQAAVAGLTIRAIRRASPDGRLFPEAAPVAAAAGAAPPAAPPAPPGPPFTWRYALGFAAANMLLIAVLAPVFLAVTAITTVNALGRGYIACDTSEVALVQKDLVREGKVVSLVGMMHVGEESFYRGLVDSIDPKGAVLLAEGVSDRKNLMRQQMQYREVAAAAGLSPQATVFRPEERGLEVVSADVDMEIFAPSTIDALNGIAELHAGKTGDVAALVRLQVRLSDPAVIERLFQDIVDRRNEHLLGAIDAALPTHERVVVPWGALHLRDIEAALVAKGFAVTSMRQRTVVRFATVLERLRAREGS